MRIQLLLVTIYLCLFWPAFAQNASTDSKKPSEAEAVKVLKKSNEELGKLVRIALDVNDKSKSFEEKIKVLRDEVERIAELDKVLIKLEEKVVDSFQDTSAGLRNLTAIVTATQNRNEQAIQNLTKVELEVRHALGQVDVNQNKYEHNLNEVAASITTHLAEIEQILKQAVIKELIGLDGKVKVLHQHQRNIDGQLGHLEQLNGLAGRANHKLTQLECGLTSLNSTQSKSLNSIENTVRGVQVATFQIDQKLGILLNNQKNIDKTLEQCKHRHQPHQPKPHEIWTRSEYAPDHKLRPEQKPEYQHSSYASEEEAEQLYKLWYGKGQQ
ncbi:myosin heavy chain, clone 203 [Drosophila kikkawai]|uniref:Myosin heavy chain, clone 203 n=1 Tax=Drosophila kikkawai TaxID=30033 RepID=A0A6P4JDU7_DROKI|nr:uncharacterized protein LOC108082687 [Drosophila kikkawai]KAH8334565.1 hypothetical protein KR059_011490 [Drosophila kikkawai]